MNDESKNDSIEQPLQQAIRIMQIITIALVTGILAFAGVAFVATQGEKAGDKFWLTALSLGFLAVMLVLRLVIPRIIANQLVTNIVSGKAPPNVVPEYLRNGPPELHIVAAYQVSLIVAHALIESAAFFMLIAFMLEKQWYPLIGAGLVVLMMLAAFPSSGRVLGWMDDQKRRLRDEHAFDSWN